MPQEKRERIEHDAVVREQIVTPEGTVTYGVIKHEQTDAGAPVFFLPGYGEGIGTITPVSETIANENLKGNTREVIMIEHSRKEFTFEQLSLSDLQKRYPNASTRAWLCNRTNLRRAHEAILVLDRLDTKGHLAGHSYGGMTAVCIGLLRPDLVESITLLNSGGLVGKSRSWVRDQILLTYRFVWVNWRKEIERHGWEKMKPIIKETFGYIFEKFGRGWRENFDVATSDMIPAMRELAQKGIKITVVYDELDNVFPADEVRKQLERIPKGTPIDIVHTNEHLHYGPVTNPKKYGARVRTVIDKTGN